MTSAALVLLALTTIPLRNPFWPVGHQGESEAISDRPRVVVTPQTEAAAEEDAKTSVTPEAIAAAAAEETVSESQYEDRLWIAARKTLRIGGTLTTDVSGGTRQSVGINGRIYADGDLVSANHEGRRFTWRVKYLTGHRTLKLQRVKSRLLEEADGKEPSK